MTSICKSSTLLAILFAAAACGSVDATMEDPNNELGPDAGVDPSDPDASEELPLVGPCSVTTGVFGLPVDLQGPGGAVIESTTTSGNDGIASFAACPRDAMISLVSLEEGLAGYRGVTMAGVQPNSHFDIRLPQTGWQGTLFAEVPDDVAELTSTRLHVGSRCAVNTEQGTSQELPISADCIGDEASAIPVLATARINNVFVYTHTEVDPVFNKNGVTNVSVNNMTNWTSGGQVALTATNLPSPGVTFQIESMRNGLSYASSSWAGVVDGDVASRDIPVPPNSFASKHRVGVSSSGSQRRGYIQLSDQSEVALDFVHALNVIEEAILDKTETKRPKVSTIGLDPEGDLGILRFRWLTKGNQEVIWRVMFPSKEMSAVTFPELSDAFEQFSPNLSLEFQEMHLINMSGDDYQGILSSGYRIGGHQMSCGEVTDSSECRFAYINPSL